MAERRDRRTYYTTGSSRAPGSGYRAMPQAGPQRSEQSRQSRTSRTGRTVDASEGSTRSAGTTRSARANRTAGSGQTAGVSRSSRSGGDTGRTARSGSAASGSRTSRAATRQDGTQRVSHAQQSSQSLDGSRGQGARTSTSPRTRDATRAGKSASRSGVATARGDDAAAERHDDEAEQFTSMSVGELRRAARAERIRLAARKRMVRIIIVLAVVAALVVGGVVLYNSPVFTIQNVEVEGVEHLTSTEMSQLANVAPDATLLHVDTDTIASRLKQSAWVEDVQVNRLFPDTLQIVVTEREVAAIVEIPANATSTVKKWAIAKDHVWLMPIPEANSEAAKTTSSKIFEDEETSLHIVDVPIGTKAEIGEACTDSNINNALDIVGGLTTELADRIAEVSAAGMAETTLVLDNGVEVAFGKAEDIRDKERVVLQILEDNEDNVSYINVRMVETPTWRSI